MKRKGKIRFSKVRQAPPLQPGDAVRVIAPAAAFQRSRFQKGAAWLRQRGYDVRFDRGIFSRTGYLAGSDQRRRREFRHAWSETKTRAIFVARGGYGSMRLFEKGALLPSKAHSKVFIGLSDITVLLNYISRTKGWVTVHGPVLAGDSFLGLSSTRRSKLFSYLEESKKRTLTAPRDFRVIVSGEARGRLWGGNLAMVHSTLGTPLQIPFKDAFLFLEEVNEPRYRIDRMFAQLALSGALSKIRALLLGHFIGPTGRKIQHRWMEKLVKHYLEGRKIPVIANIQAGHARNDVWLPIGGSCSIEQRGKRLVLAPLVGKQKER